MKGNKSLNTSEHHQEKSEKKSESTWEKFKSSIASVFSSPEKKTWTQEEAEQFFKGDFMDRLSNIIKQDMKMEASVVTNHGRIVLHFNTTDFFNLVKKGDSEDFNENLKIFVNKSLHQNQGKQKDKPINDGDEDFIPGSFYDGQTYSDNKDDYLDAIYTYIVDTIGNIAGSDIKREDHSDEAITIFRNKVKENFKENKDLSDSEKWMKALIITLNQLN